MIELDQQDKTTMPIRYFLQEFKTHELEYYKKAENTQELRSNHIPFSGSIRKHPYDTDKVILMTDPYGANTTYYEFNTCDISMVEELPNVVDFKGDTFTQVAIWVKKMSVGIRWIPFIVNDIDQTQHSNRN